LLVAISSLEAVREQNSDACNALLTELAPQYLSYEFLGVVDRDGRRFCSSAKPFPGRQLLADRPFFKQVAYGQDFEVGTYRFSTVNNVRILDFGTPYFDDDGWLRGVAYAGLGLDRMIARLLAHQLPARGEAIVAVGILLAPLMTLWYGRRFIRQPVAALLATSEQWRAGDWNARASTVERKTEFGQLAQAFNKSNRRRSVSGQLAGERWHHPNDALAPVFHCPARQAPNPKIR
jgi:hypothetical protein